MNSQTDKPKVLIIGVGNEYRGDDAFGLLVARTLKTKVATSVAVSEHHGEGASLMEAWQGYETVILIDAILSGVKPDVPVRIDATQVRIPAGLFHHSTHQFGVAEAIETARALGRLPQKLLIFGLPGESFELGQSISKSVSLQVERVAALVVTELAAP